ncbi:MAG: ferritin family protein [Candidatus Omnitrophota bacterium]
MEKQYTAKDIAQMAVQAKNRGVDLYLTLARNSENYHVARLFVELAKDEEKHKLQLKKWLDRLMENKREEAYPGETALYLKALVDTSTFNCNSASKKALEKTINEEEALQAGITFEKDFMLFLHDLKHYADKEGDETIDLLIKDEMNHMSAIFELKEKIKQ